MFCTQMLFNLLSNKSTLSIPKIPLTRIWDHESGSFAFFLHNDNLAVREITFEKYCYIKYLSETFENTFFPLDDLRLNLDLKQGIKNASCILHRSEDTGYLLLAFFIQNIKK